MVLAFPTLGQAAPGNTITSALWNANVYNGLTFLSQPPQIALYQGTAQSIGNNAWTAVALDSTTNDSYGSHSNTVNNTRVVAVEPGDYVFSGGVGFSTNTNLGRGASLYKNGSPLNGQTAVVNAVGGSAVTVVPLPLTWVQLNAGDYVELYAYQISGGALNTNGGGQYCSYLNGWLMHQ